jgi:hypothetical protein
MPSEINSNAKTVTGTYEITSASFKDVFPSYNNADKNIKISFEPETQNIVITNKTAQFLEIGSISLYYNDSIYKIANDKTKNFTNELSPNAVTKLATNSFFEFGFKESTILKVTTKMTHGKNIRFEIAIKYATLQPYQKHTLYKVDTLNLTNFLNKRDFSIFDTDFSCKFILKNF